jgi:disulfide bond formation protein DsbB
MSAAQLQEYYKPPEFAMAVRYAAVVRTFGLALLYGPLGPAAYWLASVSMIISYLSTKFALMHYHYHPPRMSDELAEGLRDALAVLVAGWLAITWWGAANVCKEPGRCLGFVPASICVFVFLLYIALPLKQSKFLQRFRGDQDTFGDVKFINAVLINFARLLDWVAQIFGKESNRRETWKLDPTKLFGQEDKIPFSAIVDKHVTRGKLSSDDVLRQHGIENTDLVPILLKYEVPIIKAKEQLKGALEKEAPLCGQRHLLRYDYTPEIFRIPFTPPTRPGQNADELQVNVVDERGNPHR